MFYWNDLTLATCGLKKITLSRTVDIRALKWSPLSQKPPTHWWYQRIKPVGALLKTGELCHSQTGSPCCCLESDSWPASSSSCEGDVTPGSSPPAQRWGRSEADLSVGKQSHTTPLEAVLHKGSLHSGPQTNITDGCHQDATFSLLSFACVCC